MARRKRKGRGTRPLFGFSDGRQTVVKQLGGDLLISFIPGIAELLDRLDSMYSKFGDLKEPLDDYGRYLVEEHIVRQFSRRGTPNRWAALSPAYKRWKDVHFPGKGILEATGRMKAAFHWRAGPRSLRIDNRRRAGRYARWSLHQTGTSTMPARRMLQLTSEVKAELSALVMDYLEEENK